MSETAQVGTVLPSKLAPDVRAELSRGLRAIYEELDAAIAARSPRCDRSGRCCRFDQWGHRLYASRAEALFFAERHGWPGGAFGHESCPYLRDGLCSAREGRPLGCRVFFCDPGYKGQAEVLTEQVLGRIGALSDRLGLPWDYRPFLEHLDALRTAAGGANG